MSLSRRKEVITTDNYTTTVTIVAQFNSERDAVNFLENSRVDAGALKAVHLDTNINTCEYFPENETKPKQIKAPRTRKKAKQ